MTRAERREMWRERVAEFQASGKSVAAWCREHEFKEHQLRYWLRKFMPVESTQPSTRWLPIAVLESEQHVDSDGQLLVRVGGATIEIRPGFNPSLLADVVQVLMDRC